MLRNRLKHTRRKSDVEPSDKPDEDEGKKGGNESPQQRGQDCVTRSSSASLTMGSKRVFFAMLLIIALGWSVASAQAQDAPSDPPLKNSTRFPLVTLSGISAGAYFATQYQIAYSGSVQGVAIFAGGPYYCAPLPPPP